MILRTRSGFFTMSGLLLPPLLLLGCASASGQPTPTPDRRTPAGAGVPEVTEEPADRAESGLALTCEVFCSPTKLRTSNARICWNLPPSAFEGRSPETIGQSLQTTVFKNGFEKGLFVTLPVTATTRERPITPIPAPKQGRLRAYQIQIIDIERRKSAQLPAGGAGVCVVIEGLEPGVNYTWRIQADTAAGKVVSPSVRCQAQVCPADLVRETREGPRD
jgi:hypothetical protein